MEQDKAKRESCLFCQIATHQQNAKIRFEDKDIIAFDDIHPQAPVHILIIPKKHRTDINQTNEKDAALLGRLILTARQLAHQAGIQKSGYRLVINTRQHAGQIINHLHLHLLGGKPLGKIASPTISSINK